jgi:hypothetical protein
MVKILFKNGCGILIGPEIRVCNFCHFLFLPSLCQYYKYDGHNNVSKNSIFLLCEKIEKI